jgi:DNA polymerase IV (DinB-like DNA polymerase)
VKSQEKITFSVGIGPNKLVAKIAVDFQKPNGLYVVKTEQIQSFLAPLPIDRLLGVGKKTNERMTSLGIKTIGDLAHYDAQKLTEIFGEKLGDYFHNAALGMDDSPVKERGEVESVSRISTLKEDTRDLAVIMNKVKVLCEGIYTNLIHKELKFKTVSVMAVMKDMSIRSRSKTFESPIFHLEMLETSTEDLFQKLLSETSMEIRRAGVKVSGFSKKPEQQKHLTDFQGH